MYILYVCIYNGKRNARKEMAILCYEISIAIGKFASKDIP